MLTQALEPLVSFVFPKTCECCGTPLPGGSLGVCEVCDKRLPRIRGPHCRRCGRTAPGEGRHCGGCEALNFAFDRAYACTLYEEGMKQLLHAYKFKSRKHLSGFLSRILIEFFDTYLRKDDFDLVTAVPLERPAENARGFNQSWLIAKTLGGHLGLPCSKEILRRRPRLSPQHALSKTYRRTNAENSFCVSPAGDLSGKRVLLVDDILTTGHTASDCARALKKAGAAGVVLLACSRGF